MKSEIHEFCRKCAQSLGALPDAIQKAAAQFERGGAVLKASLVTLNDLRARLRSLTEKLESQNAYLLIFGPLKSGKSTLMNAISGAYVSEVTSLPGYPCLVFVQHSDSTKYSLTRYNGRETNLSSGMELKAVLEDAHPMLADRIREFEEQGKPFEPGTDFPETIRRVDIKVPVPSLGDSAMILVDTPGLYSRMNFGYDMLTREFRDGAACAVFVVKTDNLFLEQVFAEFNQLLGLFSRIFIVVNVDTGKRDLAPDGSLRPSAESETPERVLEAFKTLSMAGPLRAAHDEGRVRIHAVDLLSAASTILSRSNGSAPMPEAFDAFEKDLMDYLNSSDYTREFIGDSLRQSQTLAQEMLAVTSNEEVSALRSRQDTLGTEILSLNAQIAASDQLLQTDWEALFQPLREEDLRGTEESVTAKAAQVREEIRQGFARWMSGSDSLVALPHLQWNPALTDAARSLAAETRSRLERLASGAHAGLQLSAETIVDLKTAGFSVRECGKQGLASARIDDDFAQYRMSAELDAIPVRKTFADWLFFRSKATVRSRLFGEDGSREIAAAEKERRLQMKSRAEFEHQWETALHGRFPSMPLAFAKKLADAYIAGTTENIRSGLRALRSALVSRRDARQTPFNLQAAILRAADELQQQARWVSQDLTFLSDVGDDSHSAPPPFTGEHDSGDRTAEAFVPNLLLLPPLV